jgi:hypothetical protein
MHLQIPRRATPFVSHLCKSLGGVGVLPSDGSGLRVSDAVRLRSTQPVEQYIEVTKHRQKECVMNPKLIGNYALDHLAECLYTLAARVFSTNLSMALANPSSSFVEVT